MSYRYTGRARVNPNHPQAFAVCQRCGFWINHVDGSFQMEWRGARLANIRVFVCGRCYDKPFIFNKPIIYPPDPVQIAFPYPEQFEIANNGSPFPPPLPWPVQPIGPATPGPYYLTDDAGNILYDDNGYPLVADNSPPQPPPFPVYVTPPLPPLPPDIEEGGFSEP